MWTTFTAPRRNSISTLSKTGILKENQVNKCSEDRYALGELTYTHKDGQSHLWKSPICSVNLRRDSDQTIPIDIVMYY